MTSYVLLRNFPDGVPQISVFCANIWKFKPATIYIQDTCIHIGGYGRVYNKSIKKCLPYIDWLMIITIQYHSKLGSVARNQMAVAPIKRDQGYAVSITAHMCWHVGYINVHHSKEDLTSRSAELSRETSMASLNYIVWWWKTYFKSLPFTGQYKVYSIYSICLSIL